jgi:hypothetical protein
MTVDNKVIIALGAIRAAEQNPVGGAEQALPDWLSPLGALSRAADRVDVIEDIVPSKGITWMYGPSMSFKSFVALGMASAVAAGSQWMGRLTAESVVLYIGAEGGDALHIRRAAAQGDGGGLLLMIQERPQLDTPAGLREMRSIISSLLDYNWPDIDEMEVYMDDVVQNKGGAAVSVLCVIDTYSQTAGGDEKAQVSAYIKNLRDMIDEAGRYMVDLSFVVIDHATKAGGSYLGSVAKLNDVDSQLEVVRDGSKSLVCVHQRKSKEGVGSAPVFLEMEEFTFDGYVDGNGRPLRTLRTVDGSKAKALSEVVSGKAGLLLELLADSGDELLEETLRRAFYDHSSHGDGARPDSVAKAYRRAKERLAADDLIDERDGVVYRV